MEKKSIIKSNRKRTYVTPVLNCIKLDNEISLVLQTPGLETLPGGPGCDPNEIPDNGFESTWG